MIQSVFWTLGLMLFVVGVYRPINLGVEALCTMPMPHFLRSLTRYSSVLLFFVIVPSYVLLLRSLGAALARGCGRNGKSDFTIDTTKESGEAEPWEAQPRDLSRCSVVSLLLCAVAALGAWVWMIRDGHFSPLVIGPLEMWLGININLLMFIFIAGTPAAVTLQTAEERPPDTTGRLDDTETDA